MTGHKHHDITNIAFALITVSDTRTSKTDESGPLMRTLVEGAGHRVLREAIVADEAAKILEEVRLALDVAGIDVIVTSGGTGMAKRDVTIEAARQIFAKELEGFGEAFRALSMAEIGTRAIVSRAAAGSIGERMLFCLPGSPNAVRLALEKLILPECGHLLWELRR